MSISPSDCLSEPLRWSIDFSNNNEKTTLTPLQEDRNKLDRALLLTRQGQTNSPSYTDSQCHLQTLRSNLHQLPWLIITRKDTVELRR